jgi:hypothetical protein
MLGTTSPAAAVVAPLLLFAFPFHTLIHYCARPIISSKKKENKKFNP